MKRMVLALAATTALLVARSPAMADEFDDAVSGQIQRYLSYPQAAINENLEGAVGVVFKMSKAGQVSDVRIENSSGVATLDRATIRAVYKWSSATSDVSSNDQIMHVTVKYKLI